MYCRSYPPKDPAKSLLIVTKYKDMFTNSKLVFCDPPELNRKLSSTIRYAALQHPDPNGYQKLVDKLNDEEITYLQKYLEQVKINKYINALCGYGVMEGLKYNYQSPVESLGIDEIDNIQKNLGKNRNKNSMFACVLIYATK